LACNDHDTINKQTFGTDGRFPYLSLTYRPNLSLTGAGGEENLPSALNPGLRPAEETTGEWD
jgi:hypothetical protein